MSFAKSGFGNSNEQITNYNVAKIFIRDNRYENDNEINNSSYNPLALSAGTVMGRITASGNVVALDTTQSDGSQNFVGILKTEVSLLPGASATVAICTQGDVAQEQLIFKYSGQGLETVVNSRRIKDHMQAQGIHLVPGLEATVLDNQ